MSQSNKAEQIRRIQELEAENGRLRQSLEWVNADRRELRQMAFANSPPLPETSEEEFRVLLKNHVPGSGRKFMEELGIIPKASPFPK